MTAATAPASGAIVLAGGRASRLDGFDKPLFEVDGRTLLQRAVDAVADCDPVVVVGPRRPGIGRSPATRAGAGTDLTWVRENPPFAGPAAALVAALDVVPPHGGPDDAAGPAWVFVLAADLVDPASAVARLREGAASDVRDPAVGGVCLADDEGRPQWLAGLYGVDALRRAARALPDAGANASARALLAALDPVVLAASGRETIDIDTWDDVARTGARPPAGVVSPSPSPLAPLTPKEIS